MFESGFKNGYKYIFVADWRWRAAESGQQERVLQDQIKHGKCFGEFENEFCFIEATNDGKRSLKRLALFYVWRLM